MEVRYIVWDDTTEVAFHILNPAVGVHQIIQSLVPATDGMWLTVGGSKRPAIRVYKHSSVRYLDVIRATIALANAIYGCGGGIVRITAFNLHSYTAIIRSNIDKCPIFTQWSNWLQRTHTGKEKPHPRPHLVIQNRCAFPIPEDGSLAYDALPRYQSVGVSGPGVMEWDAASVHVVLAFLP